MKHGGDRRRVSAEGLTGVIEMPAEDMLALGEVLKELESQQPRQHQIVMLRFFGGLGVSEAAEIVGIDEHTARRDWHAARLNLSRQLRDDATLAEQDTDQ